MLDVRRMKVLREVAVRGSFSAAAESLSFTQSAISQQIAALEREAGCTLVTRNARGIRLTEAGEALVRHADAVLARLAEAEAELEAIAGLRGGRLRLASFESAAASLMPLAIAAFRAEHPGVELSLIMMEPEDSAPLLRSGENDLAHGFDSRIREEVDGVARRHLLSDPMFITMPTDHPLARKRNLRLADLADDAWIAGTTDCECNRLINRACAVAGFEPRIAFQTDDYTAMQGFVAAGVGVSLIAELGLTSVREDIVVRSLGRDTPVREVYAATAADAHRTPATVAMLEILADVAARYETRRPQLQLVAG
jgi:DNA-binding transcriptional LysR family regulator